MLLAAKLALRVSGSSFPRGMFKFRRDLLFVLWSAPVAGQIVVLVGTALVGVFY